MITVRRAPAYATVQDTGRVGFRSSGVPRAGAMDIPALRTLDALLRNRDAAASIEWALTGGEVEFSSRTTFVTGGAAGDVRLNGLTIEPFRVHAAREGDVLSVNGVNGGRFLYIAVAGGIDVPHVLGSRSTYLPSAFGGFEGRRLKNGDRLPLGSPGPARRHVVTDPLPERLLPAIANRPIRYVARAADTDLTDRTWSVALASDRAGYRLEGRTIDGGASITSEPVCAGVIQLPPSGEPIVLMADAPTVGGYLIAGAVISADLGAFAQHIPGAIVTFQQVSVEQAQKAALAEEERLEEIREWALG